jgi:hypothetical protein
MFLDSNLEPNREYQSVIRNLLRSLADMNVSRGCEIDMQVCGAFLIRFETPFPIKFNLHWYTLVYEFEYYTSLKFLGTMGLHCDAKKTMTSTCVILYGTSQCAFK